MSFLNVILSGGVGSRLWPLSRKSQPKQYIPLFESRSLFEHCVRRNKKIVNDFIVVGNVENYHLSQRDFKAAGISSYSEWIEAAPRNTAASIAFAAFSTHPDDILLVTPSDHIISGDTKYKLAVDQAKRLAEQGYIVTFGAIPSRPETGYGYIEHDNVYNVLSFKEKPSIGIAKQFLDAGNYLWNSGMFCFTSSTYLQELKEFAPEVYIKAKQAFDKSNNGFLPLAETMDIPSISVDFAVMEHSRKIKVIPFDFNWNDLGSFDALWDYLEQSRSERFKNLVVGATRHVEFVGVEGLVFVETPDAILVVPRKKSQDVKATYEQLESERPELLR